MQANETHVRTFLVSLLWFTLFTGWGVGAKAADENLPDRDDRPPMFDESLASSSYLSASPSSNTMKAPKVYLIVAFEDPYDSLEGLAKCSALNCIKRRNWVVPQIIATFNKFYKGSSLLPVVRESIDSHSLADILSRDDTAGVYFMAHMRVAFEQANRDVNIVTPQIIKDSTGYNILPVFQSYIHPNIRWISLLGCNSQKVLDQLGLPSPANTRNERPASNPHLMWFGYPKLMEKPKKILEKALKASLPYLAVDAPLADYQASAAENLLEIERSSAPGAPAVNVFVGQKLATTFAATTAPVETKIAPVTLSGDWQGFPAGALKIRVEVADKSLVDARRPVKLGRFCMRWAKLGDRQDIDSFAWKLKVCVTPVQVVGIGPQPDDDSSPEPFGLEEGKQFYSLLEPSKKG